MPKRNGNLSQTHYNHEDGEDRDSQSQQRKRRRKSSENEFPPALDSSSEDEIENSIASVTTKKPSSKRKGGGEIEPVAGVIKRVSVNNFMCHHHLEVPLGSHINFVIGRNGSGKSAVLTALVVGLGGKAAVTHRGPCIKNFIMTGKRAAWVEVVLSNGGKDSYKPHIYGDKIIVRRRFTVEGGSTYAIYSGSRQHISNKREELARITEHLNIQVDNPISILNQDTSRNFLNTKSSKDKFKFFMKATQLEQMSTNYQEARNKKELTKQIISEKEETLHTMAAEVLEWETKYKNMTAVSELKAKVKEMKNEMAWAIVAQEERELKPKQKNLHREENAVLPKFVQKLEESKQLLQEREAQHKEVEAQLMEYSKEVKDLQPRLQEKKREVQQAKERLNPVVAQLRNCERELATTKRECRQCEDRIEELKTTASRDNESERQVREQEIGRLNDHLNSLGSQQRVQEHELQQHRSAVAKHKSDLAALEGSLKSSDQKRRMTQSTLNTLQAATNDRLQRFGTFIPAVVQKIKADSQRFHREPKGPIGACFDLVESKWDLAIETCLKGLVTSFLCHDHHDEKLLLAIFQSTCPPGARPSIITSAFSDRLHPIGNTRVQSDRYHCMLDVIRCDDPVVLNALIDQRTAERVLLIEDDQEARAVMSRKPPKNVKECFTIEGDQILCEPTFRYYSSDKTKVRYLMADVGEQILVAKRELEKIATEMSILVKERDVHRREIERNLQEEKKCQTKLNKLQQSIHRIQFDIGELRGVEDPVPVDVTALEEEVAGFKQKIVELQQKREEVVQERDTLVGALDQAKENYGAVEASIRSKSEADVPLREKISQAQVDLDKARAEVKHYTAKLKEKERQIQSLQEELTKAVQELDADVSKASDICPRIPTLRTVASIETEIRQTQNQIQHEEQMHGNEREVTDTYIEKRDTYNKVREDVKRLKGFVEHLNKIIEERQAKYLRMRKCIASRTKYCFIEQMHHRNFKGRMHFDFEKQTLDIHVNPSQDPSASDQNKSVLTKDLKSLSGGERSFSTVCFILSLWEAMESPFRCLDEFDVFMDMVNRRYSMQLMMEAANMHKDMQFVFLTPQDLSNFSEIRNVKIFRMPDPERSQNTLNFTLSQLSQS